MKYLILIIAILLIPSNIYTQSKPCTKQQIDKQKIEAKLDSIISSNYFQLKKLNDTIKVKNKKLSQKR